MLSIKSGTRLGDMSDAAHWVQPKNNRCRSARSVESGAPPLMGDRCGKAHDGRDHLDERQRNWQTEVKLRLGVEALARVVTRQMRKGGGTLLLAGRHAPPERRATPGRDPVPIDRAPEQPCGLKCFHIAFNFQRKFGERHIVGRSAQDHAVQVGEAVLKVTVIVRQ